MSLDLFLVAEIEKFKERNLALVEDKKRLEETIEILNRLIDRAKEQHVSDQSQIDSLNKTIDALNVQINFTREKEKWTSN